MTSPSESSTADTLVPLIAAWQRGDARAGDELFVAIGAELRGIAAGLLRNERPNHTLQPTALVNELYLKLAGLSRLEYQSRNHFLSMAARAMRQVLVDHARERQAAKRGHGWVRTDIDPAQAVFHRPADVLALDQALERLEAIDPRRARFVELRFFAGLTLEETADALEVPLATAKRHWRATRAWLEDQLTQGAPGEAGAST